MHTTHALVISFGGYVAILAAQIAIAIVAEYREERRMRRLREDIREAARDAIANRERS